MILFSRLAALALTWCAAVSGGRFPDTRVFNLEGHEQAALPGQAKAAVFLFLSVECPISNSYAPEIRRLRDRFVTNGIAFRLIYPVTTETADQIKKHLREFNLPADALRDPKQALVAETKVQVMPEAAVFMSGQGWVYRGRIDDRHVAFGRSRPAATRHDLRDVLEKIADGQPVFPTVTKAVGCYISPPP